ncbi:Gfo/Idh/MocA family oxidoreductase [Streptomyces sp. NBC_00203]|uniref:Gfo/Idh/MocA family oxidoreductase n=1 Tax=Streptomyces sp. NBC_00203 TaxID=2975680 RepID=UPI003248CACB
MTDLRLGALGFGLRGSLARIAHRPGRGSRVTVVAEHDPVLRDCAADRIPGARTVDDHHKVIGDPEVDAVLVLTPDHTHADIACEALGAGKAVFVEKPLDITIERCDRYTEDGHWPPHTQRALNPVIDVEDVSRVNMRLDNGVLAAYQQCHFTPDYWRNYTVIGDAGRLENFGDGPGGVVKVWNSRRSGQRDRADAEYRVPEADENTAHGGADPLLIDEFLRFAREGGRTDTSPVAARMAVAAGFRATESLRDGGTAREVPPLARDLVAYFERGQVRREA